MTDTASIARTWLAQGRSGVVAHVVEARGGYAYLGGSFEGLIILDVGNGVNPGGCEGATISPIA